MLASWTLPPGEVTLVMARGGRLPPPAGGATVTPWPPASARQSRGRGPNRGPLRWTGGKAEGLVGGEEGEEGVSGEGAGVTHRVQGPGAEGSDASREGLGESTYTQLGRQNKKQSCASGMTSQVKYDRNIRTAGGKGKSGR